MFYYIYHQFLVLVNGVGYLAYIDRFCQECYFIKNKRGFLDPLSFFG